MEFTLTMEDLAIGTKSAKQMIQGGTMIVNTLKAVIETGRPSLGTRALFALFRVMQPFTPKRSRTDTGRSPNPQHREVGHRHRITHQGARVRLSGET